MNNYIIIFYCYHYYLSEVWYIRVRTKSVLCKMYRLVNFRGVFFPH